MHIQKIALIATVAAAFLLGMTASTVLEGTHLYIVDGNEDPRVVLGTDPSGNGTIIVYDREGKELFAVANGEVRIPASSNPPAPQPFLAPSDNRVAMLLQVEEITPPVEKQREAFDVMEQAKEAEHKAAEAKRQLALAEGGGNDSMISYYRKRSAQLESEAKNLRARALRLERQMQERYQLVTAWTGTREIQLKTLRDMTSQITVVGLNGFFEWRGRLIDSSGPRPVYEAILISPAERPASFRLP